METMLEHWGYVGLFLLLLLGGLGLPFPQDISLLIFGALIHRHVLSWLPSLVVAYLGVVMADSLVYAIGHHTGMAGNRLTRWLGISSTLGVLLAQRLFERYGAWMVVAARFVPGSRLPTFWYAGASRLGYLRFLRGDGLAALGTVPAWVTAGYLGAYHLESLIGEVKNIEHIVGVALLIVAVVALLLWWYWRRVRLDALR